jgi:hypothetical protein
MTATTTIETGQLQLDLATRFGPRVTALRPAGGDNMFAELGDFGVDLPDGGRFVFRGGHRLWLAPEVLEITYTPDNDPVATSVNGCSASATGLTNGVEKTIRVEVDEDTAAATVDHLVTNNSDRSLEISLWAITQFRPGGTALLPLGRNPSDPAGLQASTRVVGWPYTDWSALTAGPGNDVLSIAGHRETPTKIGIALTRGWLAYLLDGWLFAKYAEVTESPLDLGATGQVYANAHFVELETLGPLVTLHPGASAQHREVWRVWPAPDTLSKTIDLVESAL